MTFEQALAEMRKGKTITRRGFKHGAKIKETQWGKTIVSTRDFKYPCGFNACDILADDWEVIE